MPQTDRKPPRLLRPDETWCPWCKSIFLTGQLFEAHRPKGWCLDLVEMGLAQDHLGSWGYVDGNVVSPNRPRRTFAQVSFDRLLNLLPPKVRGERDVMHDVFKVGAALEKDRLAKDNGKLPRTTTRRRTHAEVSFERIVKILPRKDASAYRDIERVARALDRERKRR